MSLGPQGLLQLQRTAGNQAVVQLLQRASKVKGGVETTQVVPELYRLLRSKKIPFVRELKFELLDAYDVPVLEGRTDLAFRDPSSGRLVIVEAKGVDLEALTTGQKVYVPQFEGEGARIRVTSRLGGKVKLHHGDVVTVAAEHFLRVGRGNLKDFADAIEQVTTGARVKFSWQDAEGLRWFKTEAEFDEFLASKGLERVKPAKGGKTPTTPPADVDTAPPKAQPADVPSEDFPTRVAHAHRARISRQGGFVRIGGLVYAVMLIGTTKILIDSVKANGLVETARGFATGLAVEGALAANISHLGGIGLVRASLLGQLILLEGDNPGQIELNRRNRLIDDLIFDGVPGVLEENPACFLGICLGGRYVAPDPDAYAEVAEAVGRALDDPFELEPMEPELDYDATHPSGPDCPDDSFGCVPPVRKRDGYDPPEQ